MTYTAINLGPIISTFSMSRRPRELWAASYLFSHLMKCIYETITSNNCTIISPASPNNTNKKITNISGIGIYPDRVFFEATSNTKTILKTATIKFTSQTGLNKDHLAQYFNLMSATCEANKESEAIAILNRALDVLELCNYAADKESSDAIRRLITKTSNSQLFKIATGDPNKFPFEVNTLAEIATAELQGKDSSEWKKIIENSIDLNEDFFYKALLGVDTFKDMFKSHHKYFCIVQADGDNVGKTVSHPDLADGQVKAISIALVEFGMKAAEIILNYGGMPIYAGGDDLLFIAPVIGKDSSNIFSLINKIENEAFNGVVDEVAKCGPDNNGIYNNGNKIEASLSFGISMSYYKYPLYEAFESARNLLFYSAKKIDSKKAVAWSFRKHSGGTFNAAFSLKDENMQECFTNLINHTTSGTVVSAVAHKMRTHEQLVLNVMQEVKAHPTQNNEVHPRLNALFEKILEFQDTEYFKAVKQIMPPLYNVPQFRKSATRPDRCVFESESDRNRRFMSQYFSNKQTIIHTPPPFPHGE